MNDEEVQIKQINKNLTSIIAFNFKSVERTIASTIDETDNIIGIFSDSQKNYYQFTITPSNRLSYYRLSAGEKRINRYHHLDSYDRAIKLDKILAKKKCVVGVECGSSCIPQGTICQIGIPKAAQIMTAAVRSAYKGSSRLARKAGKIALAAGATMLIGYAVSKANSPDFQNKIHKAVNASGMNPETIDKVKKLVSKVKASEINPQDVFAPKMSWQAQVKSKAKLAVDEYIRSWQKAPAQTAMAHLSAGLILYGAEQAAEHLGYIPKGTLHRTVGSEAMREKFKSNPKSKQEPFKVNDRRPNHGG